MKNKDFDLIVKYLKTHEKYKVTSKQLDTIAKFENWNNVSLQDIDRMKSIIEEHNLNKIDSNDLNAIRNTIKKKHEKEEKTINKVEREMIEGGIDAKRLGWHRRLHSYREHEKGQIEKELEGI